jgi:hypothetical protein
MLEHVLQPVEPVVIASAGGSGWRTCSSIDYRIFEHVLAYVLRLENLDHLVSY